MYNPTAPRDRVYLEGLKKLGYTVIECVDNSRGIKKFFQLAKKHQALKGQYDILWVGYLSTMLLPLAWFLSKKKIVFNALDSWYDRSVLDREIYPQSSVKAWIIKIADIFAFYFSDVILVESEQQKLFIAQNFFVSPSKLEVVFTGVDEAVFYPDPTVKKNPQFTVVFRGMFLPATGVLVVIEAARVLKSARVKFVIIGWGEPIQTSVKNLMVEYDLSNVTLITHFLSTEELRKTMLAAEVMLGQFSNHERLDRTIQNKNFEALALGLPFITRDSKSNRELLTDRVNALFVPAENPEALAEKIMELQKNSVLRAQISLGAQELYKTRCASAVLTEQVKNILEKA